MFTTRLPSRTVALTVGAATVTAGGGAGVPLAGGDQSPAPAAFLARTRTW
jgi:hypothetical protein